ncbi:hypothetical protein AK812_SmicGene44212 [Symbiodinium microadriaticum]|uniref:Uncharacterized protein n=1 Tax=Symbiodinium microadriaticum TaxID=2951 RepID=A0A1Q9BZ16_SYMMI|nr:hypothetical protein AK812_SmicGene44212 [Symbiodinium microadriaticum]
MYNPFISLWSSAMVMIVAKASISKCSVIERALWGNWVLVTLAWYACAVFTAAAMKRSAHRDMLSVFANLVIGWPLVTPFALCCGESPGRRLGEHWRRVLIIAILAGLEKNLTNSSLSHIGGALKTALHGLNVVFTLVVSAFAGADDRAKFCILGCQWRGNVMLSLSICLVTLSVREIKVRGELRWENKQDTWYPKGFTGRWLCVAAGGDCLIDYANGACDAERELPLSSLCSLAMAMQQFIETTGQETVGVQTHSVSFSTFLLCACTGPTFSVVAVVALPEEVPAELSTAELRFKATEIHAALRSKAELKEQLERLAGATAQEREEKAGNYTLSSCLDAGKEVDTSLPPEAASAAREIFARALGQRAAEPLAAFLAELPENERQEVKKLCLFDARLEILCILGDEGPKPDEVKEEKQATEEAALLLKAGEAVSESQERVTSVWAWASESAEIAVLCPQAWPLFLGALLTKRLPGPSSDATGLVTRISAEHLKHVPGLQGRLEAMATRFQDPLGFNPPAKPVS